MVSAPNRILSGTIRKHTGKSEIEKNLKKTHKLRAVQKEFEGRVSVSQLKGVQGHASQGKIGFFICLSVTRRCIGNCSSVLP